MDYHRFVLFMLLCGIHLGKKSIKKPSEWEEIALLLQFSVTFSNIYGFHFSQTFRDWRTLISLLWFHDNSTKCKIWKLGLGGSIRPWKHRHLSKMSQSHPSPLSGEEMQFDYPHTSAIWAAHPAPSCCCWKAQVSCLSHADIPDTLGHPRQHKAPSSLHCDLGYRHFVTYSGIESHASSLQADCSSLQLVKEVGSLGDHRDLDEGQYVAISTTRARCQLSQQPPNSFLSKVLASFLLKRVS